MSFRCDFTDLSCLCNTAESTYEISASLTDNLLPNLTALSKLNLLASILDEYLNVAGNDKFICWKLENAVCCINSSHPLEEYLINKILGEDKLLQFSAGKLLGKLCSVDKNCKRLKKFADKVFYKDAKNLGHLLGFTSFFEITLTKPSYLSQENVGKPKAENVCEKKTNLFVDHPQSWSSHEPKMHLLIEYLPKILTTVENSGKLDITGEQLRMCLFRIFQWNLDEKSEDNTIRGWLLSNPVSLINLFAKTTSYLVWEKGTLVTHEVIGYRNNVVLSSQVPTSINWFTHVTLDALLGDNILENVTIPQNWRGFGGCDIEMEAEMECKKFRDSEFVEASVPLLQNLSLCILASLSTQAKSFNSSTITDMLIKGLAEKAEQFDAYVSKHVTHCCDSPGWIVELFKNQDDALASALLYCLDFIMNINGRKEEFSILEYWDPHKLFRKFLDAIGSDHSVLLDLIISEETCFLLYLLRYLKLCNKILQKEANRKLEGSNSNAAHLKLVDYETSDEDDMHSKESPNRSCDLPNEDVIVTADILERLLDNIEKLHVKSLFPYNPSPLLYQLKMYLTLVNAT